MRKVEGVIPTSSEQAYAMLAGRATLDLAKNTKLVLNSEDGTVGLKLHNTIIVTYRLGGSMKLNAGGWRTATTKARMNAAIARSGCKIVSVKGEWQVWGITTNVRINYFDGLVVASKVTA